MISLGLVTIVWILSSCSSSGGTAPTLVEKPSAPEQANEPPLDPQQARQQEAQPVVAASSGRDDSADMQPSWSYIRLPNTHEDDNGQIFYDDNNQIVYFLSFRRNRSISNHSTLFISRGMAQTVSVAVVFHERKELFFDRLYFQSGVCIAYSRATRVAAVSSNKGERWSTTKFRVEIKSFVINEKLPRFILALSVENLAYVSFDSGVTWKYFSSSVHSAIWSKHSTFLYYLKSSYDSSGRIGLNLFRADIRSNTQTSYILESVSEIGTLGDIMFAKRNRTKAEILISTKDAKFRKCEFPTRLVSLDMMVRAVTTRELFIVVRVPGDSLLLYSGLLFDLKFVKISSNIGEFDSFFNVSCVNLETFPELPGVVITNNGMGARSPVGLYTAISFSHGSRWSHLVIPSAIDGKRCDWPECRLLLHLECNSFLTREVAETAQRAPHLMVAHGLVVNGTSKLAFGLYISDDAGLTWRMASTSFQEFSILNDGGAILTFPRLAHGAYFSYDFGLTWKSSNITTDTFRVIRAMHDHSGASLAACAVGYDETTNEWVFIKTDFSKVFEKDCQPSDYNFFTPGRGNASQCFQGSKNFIYRRRHNVTCRSIIAKLPTLNSSRCPCRKEDFGCSFGRLLKDDTCVSDPDYVQTNQTCNLGEFVFSDSSYAKLDGDACIATRELVDEEANVCQFTSTDDTLTLMLGSVLKYASLNSSDDLQLTALPVKLLSPQAPVAFDIDHKSRCLYYLNSSGIVKSCWATRAEASLGKEAFVVSAPGLLGVEFEHLGRNIYYYRKNRVSVINVENGHRKDVHDSAGDIVFVELFHSMRYMLVYSISNEDGKLKHTVLKLTLNGSVVVTIVVPERIVAASVHDTGHIVLFAAESVYQYQSDGSSYVKTKLVNKRVIHARLSKTKEVIVTDVFVMINNRTTFFPSITDVDIFFASDLANNPCSVSNCKYFCFPTGDYSYACGCPTNMVVDKTSSYDCACDASHPGCMDCAPGEFQCDTKTCMDQSVKCNGVNDCGDGSDEKDCKYSCTNDEFQCKDNSKCVSLEGACDGVQDCPDGSDELGCPTATTCSADQFRCFNGACIPLAKRCNGANDCGDFSDEESCNNCKQGEVKCNNGECILPIQVCNGVFDCHDWSDEQGCSAEEGNKSENASCSLKCAEKCISADKMCDHYMDCPSGEDETECNHSFSCLAGGYANCFSTAECYKRELRCNGFSDCSDSSDEFGCPGLDRCSLPEKFVCSSDGICIPPNQYCDGKFDCSDNSDEPADCRKEPMVTQLGVAPMNDDLTPISWQLQESDRRTPLNVTLVPWNTKNPKREFIVNGTELRVQGLAECGAYTVVVKPVGARNGRALQFVARRLNPGVPEGISFNSGNGVLSWRLSAYSCQPSQYHVICGSDGKVYARYFVGQNKVSVKYNSSTSCMISSCPSPVFNLSCSKFSEPFRLSSSGRDTFAKVFFSTLAVVGVIALVVLYLKQRGKISLWPIKRLFAQRGATLDVSGSSIVDGQMFLHQDEDEIDL